MSHTYDVENSLNFCEPQSSTSVNLPPQFSRLDRYESETSPVLPSILRNPPQSATVRRSVLQRTEDTFNMPHPAAPSARTSSHSMEGGDSGCTGAPTLD